MSNKSLKKQTKNKKQYKSKRYKKSKNIKSNKSKKKYNNKEFKEMYNKKEKEYLSEYYKCNRKCSKIINKTKKKNCFKKCEDLRLKGIQDIQKKYPKEWNEYLKNL